MKVKLVKGSFNFSPEDFEKVFSVAYMYVFYQAHTQETVLAFGVLFEGNILNCDLEDLIFIDNELEKDWKIRVVNKDDDDYSGYRLIIGPEEVIPDGNLNEILLKDTPIGNPLINKILDKYVHLSFPPKERPEDDI